VSARVVSLDFELAGVLDLTDVGADVWTKHPDTVPILAGFAIDYDPPWCIEFDAMSNYRISEAQLLSFVAEGAEIHAWNAPFEWAVWNNICAPRFGWPALPIERFHCTMAAAACAGLPMSLEDAAKAVGSTSVKDKAGHALMLRMARPRRFDQNHRPVWWHREDPAKLAQLIAYNRADVLAEREVHQRIPRMSPREREIWLVDQHMNQRGLPVDKELLVALHGITLQELLRLNAEIARITKGVVSGATQNLKLLEWVRNEGYPHASLARGTLLPFIGTPEFFKMTQDGQDVLTLRAEAAKTSTAKLSAIHNYAHNDWLARNLVQYGGAVRTLRWAGRGPQIQNFPRPVVKHVNAAIEQILKGMDANGLRLLFGRPLDVVSSCLRGVFKAPDGFSLVVCDYHAIEAIVLAWLAEFDELLDVFRRHEDVYVFTAQAVGSTNRTLGKVLRLACGYGMGPGKFQETAATHNLFLTAREAHVAVHDFRLANAPIVSLWHACEATAKRAIDEPENEFTFQKLKFRMANPKGRLKGSLLMELPSGRNLVYRNARIEDGRIVFWGVHQITRQWCELDTYGGKLVENATQAVARDLLADTMVNLERDFPGTLLTTVHDEIIATTKSEDADELFHGMKPAMNTPPAWAKGMPLSCAGGIVERYGKL
jgi:DNA polymerase bacteriophage-type